jgi:NAD(P)-dependent dehydrogenase (short-subunit alcohol dehydrogenase family)
MKLKDNRPFADPEAAMSKLLEIANGLEADHAGRAIYLASPASRFVTGTQIVVDGGVTLGEAD